jgi:hypothetical protein
MRLCALHTHDLPPYVIFLMLCLSATWTIPTP